MIVLLGYQNNELIHISYWKQMDENLSQQINLVAQYCQSWHLTNDVDRVGDLEWTQ
jgi:hypothetical protein